MASWVILIPQDTSHPTSLPNPRAVQVQYKYSSFEWYILQKMMWALLNPLQEIGYLTWFYMQCNTYLFINCNGHVLTFFINKCSQYNTVCYLIQTPFVQETHYLERQWNVYSLGFKLVNPRGPGVIFCKLHLKRLLPWKLSHNLEGQQHDTTFTQPLKHNW